MRTRRQDKADAVADEAVSDLASSTGADLLVVNPTRTVTTISKAEGPEAAEVASQRKSRLPRPIRFPLLAILSLSLSSLGYSVVNEWTKGELATYARQLVGWEEVGLMAGWRILELALGWFGDFDGYDLAALNVLSHGPPLYLLTAFYGLSPITVTLALAVDTLSTYLPFRLLRPLSGAHALAPSVPNRDIIADLPIAAYTTLLAAIIYTISLFFAYKTYLPLYLVVYFDNIPSIDAAHSSTYVQLLPVTLLFGLAARTFIFTPAEATPKTEEDDKNAAFDPVEATLGETVRWNVWGWSSMTKTVVKRTAAVALVTGVNTWLQCKMTIDGVEDTGAAAWASVWVLAAAVTGLGLGVVGGV